ncbi:MAG: hypothetical protein ACRDD1_04170, partial [Planctomycetia bacterium]
MPTSNRAMEADGDLLNQAPRPGGVDPVAVTALVDWLQELDPLRTLIVAPAGRRHHPAAAAVDALHSAAQRSVERRADRAMFHLENHRPEAVVADEDSLPSYAAGPRFDLLYLIDPFRGLSADAIDRSLVDAQRLARFIVVFSPTEGLVERSEIVRRAVEARVNHDWCARLLHGGRNVALDADGATPRVWYLAPNRQIFGGVKILYNHVDLLNGLGIPAVLGLDGPMARPAQWFGWNPRNLRFGDHARRNVRLGDVVVVPEFRWRDAELYPQASRRLLFAQNPGLCHGIDQW